VVAIIAGMNWIDEKLRSHPVFAKHPKGAVSSVTYSPDGGRIATASADGTIVIWNAETAEKITSFDVMKSNFLPLTFSPDGTRLAIGGTVWDAATGKKLFTLAGGHDQVVRDIAYSPDGTRLATASSDAVQVWDANTGEKLFVLEGGGTLCVRFSPDGSRLETGSSGGTVRLCDAATGKVQRTIELKMQDGAQRRDEICRVGFGGDGKQILGVGWSSSWTWDAATGNEIRSTSVGLISADRSFPNTRAINPATNQVVAAYDNWVHVLDPTTGQVTHKLRTTPNWTPSFSPGQLRSVAISQDGTRVVGGGRDGTIRVWKLNE
jgi:WD40 repeat protein